MPIYKRINKDFFKKWTKEMSYVLGFFAADGNLSINKRGGCYISFESKDRQIIFDIRNVIESKNKISKRINKLNKKVSYRLQIGSKKIVVLLQRMGFSQNKTKHLPFPNIPQNKFSHFLRGYFDGDGNIWQGEVHKERKTKHKVLQLAFTSGAPEFLNQLKNLLHSELGTGGSYITSKRGQYHRLQYSTKDALKIYKFMYNKDNSILLLKRKKQQFDRNIRNLRL
jgi:hypothetical protein